MSIARTFSVNQKNYIDDLNGLVSDLNAQAASLGATWIGLAGTVKSVAGSSDVTLTTPECGNLFIYLSGALTGNINVIVPARVGAYIVVNSTAGSFTLTFKTSGGSGVVLRQGSTNFVATDTVSAFLPVGTLPNGAEVDGQYIQAGKATLGQGGQFRARDDGGTSRWLAGISGSGGARDFWLYDIVNAGARLMINATTGLISMPTAYSNTTASAANMFVDSAGVLYRSTSSEVYKHQIEPMSEAAADAIIDGAQAIWFRSRCDGDNPDWSFYGLSAEALAKIDPRLVMWAHPEITVEEETPSGEVIKVTQPDTTQPMRPVGVHYGVMCVPLILRAQRDRAQIEALESALTALTARVEALEAPK